jgi:hypothetical protein
MNAKTIIKTLESFATPERKKINKWFFKTGIIQPTATSDPLHR